MISIGWGGRGWKENALKERKMYLTLEDCESKQRAMEQCPSALRKKAKLVSTGPLLLMWA